MNASNGHPHPMMINIGIGGKKSSSSKKKRSSKKETKLLKGQMTLTQMPCMSPNLGDNFEEGTDEDSLSVDLLAEEPPKKFKSDHPLENEEEKIDSLTVIPYVPKTNDTVTIFTVGDLVEMDHHVLQNFVQLGLVKANVEEGVEVYWLWTSPDGNEDLVCVHKVDTVAPTALKRLAKFDEPLDGKDFNWWKYKGIMQHFVFYADGRGWRFRANEW